MFNDYIVYETLYKFKLWLLILAFYFNLPFKNDLKDLSEYFCFYFNKTLLFPQLS